MPWSFSWTKTKMISSSPTTKVGAEIPARTPTVAARSKKLRALVADRMPTEIPAISQSSTPPMTTEMVGGRSCLITVVTGSWRKYDFPRLPCSSPVRKCQYWTEIGLSSP